MRTHFTSRLALTVLAGALVVATQVWTGDVLQWIGVGGGALAVLIAGVDAGVKGSLPQRALDGGVIAAGAWMVVESLLFSGGVVLWLTFATALGIAVLAIVGLVLHELRTEKVVHSFDVAAPVATDGFRDPIAA